MGEYFGGNVNELKSTEDVPKSLTHTFCQAANVSLLASTDRAEHSRKPTKQENVWSTLEMQKKLEKRFQFENN